jgi:SEC-C motif domain protein
MSSSVSQVVGKSGVSVLALDAPCACGSGVSFGACCEPIIAGKKLAGTAEALMRSRFSAHVVRDYGHLHRTFTGTVDKPYVAEDDRGDLNWTRLVVHAHETGPKADVAYVDFSAYFQDEGAEQAIHEKSEFLNVKGAWFYHRSVRNGPAPVKSSPKVGRNEPCPCGSGKKFKQCCG